MMREQKLKEQQQEARQKLKETRQEQLMLVSNPRSLLVGGHIQ
jgi:hypothetical protein